MPQFAVRGSVNVGVPFVLAKDIGRDFGRDLPHLFGCRCGRAEVIVGHLQGVPDRD